MAPNFGEPFKLMVDVSDVGCGAVLLQEDDSEIDHPVSYFSYRFNTHQKNYSSCEKETLADTCSATLPCILGCPCHRNTGVYRS